MTQATNPSLSRTEATAERAIARSLVDGPWLCRDEAPGMFPGETCGLSLEHAVTLDEQPDEPQLWHGNAELTVRWDATGARATVSPDYEGAA